MHTKGQETMLMVIIAIVMAGLIGISLVVFVRASLDPQAVQKPFFRKDIGMTLAAAHSSPGQLSYVYKADPNKFKLDIQIVDQTVTVYNESLSGKPESSFKYVQPAYAPPVHGQGTLPEFYRWQTRGNNLTAFIGTPSPAGTGYAAHCTPLAFVPRVAITSSEPDLAQVIQNAQGNVASPPDSAAFIIIVERGEPSIHFSAYTSVAEQSRSIACHVAAELQDGTLLYPLHADLAPSDVPADKPSIVLYVAQDADPIDIGKAIRIALTQVIDQSGGTI